MAAIGKHWQRVLALLRQYWSPDAPGGFWSGMPKLSERVQAACRASDVFRDFETTEQLHTWAKKRFVVPALSPCEVCRKREEEHKAEGHLFKLDASLPSWHGTHSGAASRQTFTR